MAIWDITGTPLQSLNKLRRRQKEHDFSTKHLPKEHLKLLRKLGLLVGDALTAEAYELTTKTKK